MLSSFLHKSCHCLFYVNTTIVYKQLKIVNVYIIILYIGTSQGVIFSKYFVTWNVERSRGSDDIYFPPLGPSRVIVP